MTPRSPAPPWVLLSSHGQVLVCLARDPGMRLRDLAGAIGLTERAVQSILGSLEAQGLVTRGRVGRRNRYQLHREREIGLPAGQPWLLSAVLGASTEGGTESS